MLEIILSSKKPVLVEVLNAKAEVSSIKQKYITFDAPVNFNFKYNFLGENSIVYNAEFSFTNNNLVCNNPHIKVVCFEQNKYLVQILQQNSFFLQKKVKKIQLNNVFYNFYQNGLIEIESSNEMLFSEIYDFHIIDADVLPLNNGFVACKLFGAQQDACLILNNNFVEVDFAFNSIIEPTENGYKILTTVNDIARHGVVKNFVITNTATLHDEYSVYLKGRPIMPSNQNVVPLCFAQCIKAKDYVLAKSFLSEDLKAVAKPEHLANFFGDFVNVYTDIFNGDINTLCFEYQQNKNYYIKKYNFKLNSQKIVNIS